jgi:hypothetical protein
MSFRVPVVEAKFTLLAELPRGRITFELVSLTFSPARDKLHGHLEAPSLPGVDSCGPRRLIP